jgi:hypothetical protein
LLDQCAPYLYGIEDENEDEDEDEERREDEEMGGGRISNPQRRGYPGGEAVGDAAVEAVGIMIV